MSIKVIHQSAMSQAFHGKRHPPDCAHCRHSKVEPTNAKAHVWRFVCKEGVAPMDAPTCPKFKDSRMPSALLP